MLACRGDRCLVKRILEFPSALARIHPAVYGCLYLILIPIYALSYYNLSHDFYGPYVRFERYARSDAYRIGVMIEDIIRTRLNERLRSTSLFVDNYEIRQPDLLYVQKLKAEDESRINFDVLVMLWDRSKNGNIQIPISITMSRASRIITIMENDGKLVSRNFRIVNLASPGAIPSDLGGIEKAAFKIIFCAPEWSSSCDFPAIPLSEAQESEFSRFFDGLGGDPTSITGSYWRMFYFSAMVITTVGFGDIVPMTPIARAMVTGEAIFGVVIVGLFLTAVAFRASSRN